MFLKTTEHRIETTKHFELVDISNLVRKAAGDSGISNGFVTVYSYHTTCCIRINEFEKNLIFDFEAFFEKIAPQHGEYTHNSVDPRANAHSHMLGMFLNSSETIPIKDGELLLGRYQVVFFVEIDGPRTERRFFISVMGE